MAFTKLLLSYILTFIVFILIDLTWIGIIAKDFYNKQLGSFLSGEVNWPAAIFFYLLFIVGIFVFVIVPALQKNSLGSALVLGALFGFVTYATYDLTNLATVKDWPIKVVVIDMLWGAALTCVVSGAGFLISKWLS